MTISEESTTPTNNINTLRDNSYKRAPLPTPNQSEAEIVEKSATNNIEGNGPLGNREIKGKRTEELSFRLPAGNLADKEEERRFSISSFTSQSSSLFEERAPDPPLADGKTTSSTKANKRLRIFQEIVETERRYCQDLEFIKVAFLYTVYIPIRQSSDPFSYFYCRTIEIRYWRLLEHLMKLFRNH